MHRDKVKRSVIGTVSLQHLDGNADAKIGAFPAQVNRGDRQSFWCSRNVLLTHDEILDLGERWVGLADCGAILRAVAMTHPTNNWAPCLLL